jgi:hypothetical protein
MMQQNNTTTNRKQKVKNKRTKRHLMSLLLGQDYLSPPPLAHLIQVFKENFLQKTFLGQNE